MLLTVSVAVAACGGEGARPPAAGAPDSAGAEVAGPPIPAPTLSRFDVPLEYDFTPVLTAVERAIPLTFGSMDERHQIGDNDRKHFAFTASRGPFIVFARGGEVHLRTVLSYAARAYYNPPVAPTMSAGCGDGTRDRRPGAVIELVAPLSLSANWHLQSHVHISHIVPASDSAQDHCLVSFLHLDVTERVMAAAREAVTSQLPGIDRRVAAISLEGRATRWWTTLNNPIRLADGVWLLLQPRQLRYGGVTGVGHVLRVRTGLDAYPAIVVGPKPLPAGSPLPPLGNDTASSGFRVQLDGTIQYAAASRTFTAQLRGKSITQGGRTITIRSVNASRSPHGRFALAVAFDGDAAGTVRFVGTPKYDRAAGRIQVPDLDYDLETDSRLINAYTWLRSEALRSFFRDKASLPVAPLLARARTLVLKGINRTIDRVVTLAGMVDSVAVLGLYVTPAGVLVRTSAAGTARVAVKP